MSKEDGKDCEKYLKCLLRVPCATCDDYDPCDNAKLVDPLDIQVGGDHYKNFPIQPIEYTMRNRLSFCQGCVIKRITRFDQPTGKGLEDLEKAKHEIDMIIKFFKESS
jgi:hypothetical protein